MFVLQLVYKFLVCVTLGYVWMWLNFVLSVGKIYYTILLMYNCCSVWIIERINLVYTGVWSLLFSVDCFFRLEIIVSSFQILGSSAKTWCFCLTAEEVLPSSVWCNYAPVYNTRQGLMSYRARPYHKKFIYINVASLKLH